MKKFIVLFIALTSLSLSVDAQKFGHLNSSLLLTEMPEIKNADAQLEAYQKTLMETGQEMVKTLEANFKVYQTAAQSGTLSALEMQSRESALQEEQTKIKEYEVDMQTKLAQKREELYKPLLDKVKAAIEDIGKQEGYTMIFDTSVAGAIVHAEASEDILPKVKTALGL